MTVTATYPPPTVTITANPDTIQVGEIATLTWSSTYANSCFIEPSIGAVDPNGSITASPAETTIYTITAIGSGGTATASLEGYTTGNWQTNYDEPGIWKIDFALNLVRR